jgi:HlyD family secretion protein
MDGLTDIKAQLHSLRISKDQRPQTASARCRCGWGGWLCGVAIVAAGGIALYVERDTISAALNPAAAAAEVKIVKVTGNPEPAVTPVLTATGKVVSDHRVQVTTKVSGQITALFFEQGDRVEQRQRLATIEDVIYKARRDEAAARLEKARAELEFQKYNFERISGLMEQKTAAHLEFAEATRLMRAAEAQLAADQAALTFCQKSLDDCVVVAPIAGVVLERNVEVGDFVAAEGGRGANANAQFALIADMTKLRVEVDVSELDIARIHDNMPCTIVPEAYKDRKYQGHVLWIDPGANYSKATVQVKVRINNPDDHLRVEGSAQVVFVPPATTSSPAEATAAAVWIPLAACAFDSSSDTARVFVLSNGRLREQTITVGRRQAGQVEVRAGLQLGQSIVGERLKGLAEGQRVRS